MSHGMRNTTLALAAGCLMLLACATQSGSRAEAATDRCMPTAKAIDAALAGSQRSEANRARDVYRHPKQTLTFFGLRQDMTVVEIWPGAGGWYTEVLAPILKDHGKLYAAQYATRTPRTRTSRTNTLERYRERLPRARTSTAR